MGPEFSTVLGRTETPGDLATARVADPLCDHTTTE